MFIFITIIGCLIALFRRSVALLAAVVIFNEETFDIRNAQIVCIYPATAKPLQLPSLQRIYKICSIRICGGILPVNGGSEPKVSGAVSNANANIEAPGGFATAAVLTLSFCILGGDCSLTVAPCDFHFLARLGHTLLKLILCNG